MKWKKNSAILLAVLLIAMAASVVTAYDFDPGRDINLRDRYDIKNVVEGEFTCLNISGDYRCEWPTDPSGRPQHNSLAGLQGGTTTERYHVNESIYNKLVSFVFSWIMADYFDQSLNTTDNVTFNDMIINKLIVNTTQFAVVDIYRGDSNMGLYLGSLNAWLWSNRLLVINSDKEIHIKSDIGKVIVKESNLSVEGDVGIGTSTPQNTLNVIGDINSTGLFYGNGSQMTGIPKIGNCPLDQFVQNTTTGGVECAVPAGGGDITGVLTTLDNYLYNGSETGNVYLRFNETVLNTTIDARAGQIYFADENYINLNASNYFIFNETYLNKTGDNRWLLKTGDTTTGDYNFSNTLFIDSTNGNVGIGTTDLNIYFPLEIEGYGYQYIELKSLGTSFENEAGIAFENEPTTTWYIYIDPDDAFLHFFEDGAQEVMVMENNTGNIGIGTTTPQNKLNVIGDGNFTGLIYGNGSQLTGVITTANEGNLNVNSSDYWDGLNTSADISITESQISNLKNYIEAAGDTMEGTLGFAGYPFTISSSSQIVNLNASYAGVAYDLSCTDCIGGTEINETSLTVDAETLDTYDSGFFMPLNTSPIGTFSFNGGWASGGLTISGGDIYAQAGYFYDIVGLNVSNLEINGSLLPATGFDNTFDIGNNTLRWKDIYLSGELFSNSTGDSYFLGKVGIGTTTPSHELNVIGDANITVDALIGRNLDVTGKSTFKDDIDVNGTVTADEFIGGGGGLTGIVVAGEIWNRSAPNIFPGTLTDTVSIGTTTVSSGQFEVYQNASDAEIVIHEDWGDHEAILNFKRGGDTWQIVHNQNLSFQSEKVEKMMITQAGLVGIGTSSPGQELDISANTNATIRLTSSDTTMVSEDYGRIEFYTNDTSRGPRVVAMIKAKAGVSGAIADLTFHAWDATSDLGLPPELMRITNTGLVGIGTSSPTEKLQVVDTANDLQARFGDTGTPSLSPAIRFTGEADNGDNRHADIQLFGEDYILTLFAPAASTPTIKALNIDSAGQVGIGDTTPSYTLDVAGTGRFAGRLYANLGVYVADGKFVGIGSTGERIVFDETEGFIEIMGADVGIGDATPDAKLDVAGDIQLDGLLKGTSYKKFILPGTGRFNGVIQSGAYYAVNRFENGVQDTWYLNVQVPTGATDFASIKIYYAGGNTGNLYLHFLTSRFDTDTAGAAITTDVTEGVAQYAGQASGTGIITVPAGAYNGLTFDEGDIFGISISRRAGNVLDTYEDHWNVVGVEFIFS